MTAFHQRLNDLDRSPHSADRAATISSYFRALANCKRACSVSWFFSCIERTNSRAWLKSRGAVTSWLTSPQIVPSTRRISSRFSGVAKTRGGILLLRWLSTGVPATAVSEGPSLNPTFSASVGSVSPAFTRVSNPVRKSRAGIGCQPARNFAIAVGQQYVSNCFFKLGASRNCQ